VGSSFQLVFAPIADFPDDAPLISSGFRVIPLDTKTVKHFHPHYSLSNHVLYLGHNVLYLLYVCVGAVNCNVLLMYISFIDDLNFVM
jgi:hypothetical protein